MATDAAPSERIRHLVAECVVALERGEADPIAAVCAGDPDLVDTVRRRVQRLRGLGLVPERPPQRDELPSFGAYVVQCCIGAGGMGSVWAAEQLEPVRRPVALKVLKLGMDSAEVLARFAGERQALARLDHPNIAKVFDAGLAPGGRPFFAMELVEGAAITEFARQRGLDVRARVRLLLPVCEAVTHAHRRGLIHRDLKPSNILVRATDGRCHPVVIDFGVAKALDAAHGDRTAFTTHGSLLGTPQYMSPEQAEGCDDIDSRTDVWALGVVLYELLTGGVPFDLDPLRGAGLDRLRHLLREVDPVPPSRCLPPGQRRAVAGELDWIVLHALEKDRERRYGSVGEFADDLRRHLQGATVRAAPPSRRYRLAKVLRRHRVAAALAAVLLLGLVFAFGGITLGLREARAQGRVAAANFADALEAIDTLLVRASRLRLEDVPHATEIEVEFRRDALAALERLLERNQDNVDLRRRVATATFALADGLFELTRREEALASATAARAQCLGLRADGVATPDIETTLGKAHRLIADAHRWAGARDLTLAGYRSALAVFEAACARQPCREIDERLLASVHTRLAGEASSDRDPDAAREHLDAAYAIRRRLVAREPENREHLQALAATHHRYAMHFGAVGDLLTASANAEEALRIFEQLTEGESNRDQRRGLCAVLTLCALLDLERGLPDLAEARWRRAIELWGPLLDDYPHVPILMHESAQPAYYLAALLSDRWHREPERLAEVAELAGQAADRHRRAHQLDPADTRFAAQLVRALDLRGHALRALDDPPVAEIAAIEAELSSLGDPPVLDYAFARHRRNAEALRAVR